MVENLYSLLENELIYAIGKNTKVGILLSGGIDSRFVAGILQNLIKTKSVNLEKVVAYTWGEENSRDFQYAKLIANELNWHFESFRVSATDLWANINLVASRGCEYSSLHLHAMPSIAIKSENDVDVMLAGSYGDSVGRAEYSGKHATKLQDFKNVWGKYSSIISSKDAQYLKGDYIRNLREYRERFIERKNWQINDIERQCHYMRRMLNPCMEVINDKTPIYQLFTHPSVYGYIWSFDSNVRNDSIYYSLLKKIDPILQEIPWARTGLIYGKTGIPDNYKKTHHRYGEILNFELLDLMEDTIKSCSLFEKDCAIFSLIKLVRKYPLNNIDYLEKISYLASVAIFYNRHENRIGKASFRSNDSDKFKLHVEYGLKSLIRKFT